MTSKQHMFLQQMQRFAIGASCRHARAKCTRKLSRVYVHLDPTPVVRSAIHEVAFVHRVTV